MFLTATLQDPNAERIAYAKKTDAVQADHEDGEQEEEEARATNDSPETTKRATSPRTTKKSDLDEPIAVDENSSSAVDDDESAGTDNEVICQL